MKIKGKIINEEWQEWITDFEFDVNLDNPIPEKNDVNFDTLSNFILDLQENEDVNNQLRNLVRTISLNFEQGPIIIYTEVGDLDMSSLYKYHIEGNLESSDEVKSLLKEDDEDLAGDFLSNITYSVESLLSM